MTSPDLLALASAKYVSLTTFKRSGDAVPTPVWLARDGDDLVVVTEAETGKAKRIRNSGRVELRPCDMRGRVADGATLVAGHATIVADETGMRAPLAALAAKYGIQWKLFGVAERFRGAKRGTRIILRIGEPVADAAPAPNPSAN